MYESIMKYRYISLISRLLGISCDQVNVAIVSQIKAMASYKVRQRLSIFTIYLPEAQHHLNFSIFVLQLVSVTPKLIQANHTSGFGQLERVNFTMISTSMILGCHVQVRDTTIATMLGKCFHTQLTFSHFVNLKS